MDSGEGMPVGLKGQELGASYMPCAIGQNTSMNEGIVHFLHSTLLGLFFPFLSSSTTIIQA